MHWQFGEMEFGEMKRNTSNWSNFGMLSRRAGLTASAALSCYLLLSDILTQIQKKQKVLQWQIMKKRLSNDIMEHTCRVYHKHTEHLRQVHIFLLFP